MALPSHPFGAAAVLRVLPWAGLLQIPTGRGPGSVSLKDSPSVPGKVTEAACLGTAILSHWVLTAQLLLTSTQGTFQMALECGASWGRGEGWAGEH